jgi:MerR family transcriptional regulator/heat shock protein HspR
MAGAASYVAAARPPAQRARTRLGLGGKTLDNAIVRSYVISVASGRRPVYVISIAASLAGCHPRTLRIYEEEGLLDPVRTDTNIRLYSDEDLERVRAIRYLTQIRGVNLAGVKLLLQLRNTADLLDEIASELEREGTEALGEVRVEPVSSDVENVRKPRNRQRRKGVEL